MGKENLLVRGGRRLIDIAYLVEGLGTLSNEIIRDWLGGDSSPTSYCSHCSWKKKYNLGLKSGDWFGSDIEKIITQFHFPGGKLQVRKDLIVLLNYFELFHFETRI